MPLSLKTDDLPVSEIRPILFEVTPVGFELRKTQNGEPYINITLNNSRGQKSFDRIWLRQNWFDDEFDAGKIADPQERKNFHLNVGSKNRPGKLQRYLNGNESSFATPQEVVALLSALYQGERAGYKFVARRVQQKDRDTKLPTDNYNLYLAERDRVPKSWLTGSVNLLPEEEAKKEKETQ